MESLLGKMGVSMKVATPMTRKKAMVYLLGLINANTLVIGKAENKMVQEIIKIVKIKYNTVFGKMENE